MQRQGRCRSDATRPRTLSLLFLTLFCAAAFAGQRAVFIIGQVRMESGYALSSSITIQLDSADGIPVTQIMAQPEGQFEFRNLGTGTYRLTATAKGFQPSTQEVVLNSSTLRASVTLYLKPIEKTPTVDKSLPALTDMAAPKKARKEYSKGARALAKRDLPEAQAQFEKAVAEYPCYARAQTDLAVILFAQRHPTGAEAALRKAIDCDADFLNAYSLLGRLFIQQRNYSESEKVLREALRRAPGDWGFHYQLGTALYGQGLHSKAEEAYLKVRELISDPPPELHTKLAAVYLEQGAEAKAYQELAAYLRARPTGPFADKVRERMAEIESKSLTPSP